MGRKRKETPPSQRCLQNGMLQRKDIKDDKSVIWQIKCKKKVCEFLEN